MPPREPTPELMRLFPPLTRWSPEVWASVYRRTLDDVSLMAPDDLREELGHLCEVWELAAYGFRHRHVSGQAWLYARQLVRQARTLMEAFYYGHEDLYLIFRKRDTYLLLQAEVQAAAERERLALARAGKHKAAAERKADVLRRLAELRRAYHHLTKAEAMKTIAEEQEVAISTLYNWLRDAKKSRSSSA